jgi:hypothetical protein
MNAPAVIKMQGGSARATQSQRLLLERLNVLFACFNKPPAEQTFAAYAEVLQDLSPRQIQHAFGQALKRCKFLPVPSELLEMAKEVSTTPPHPADCDRCGGSGWFYHPELRRAVRCRDFSL